MVPHMISYEAPAIMILFQQYFQTQDFVTLKSCALQKGVTEEEWKAFIAYCGGFYGNLSNYHSFGDMKFVPDLDSAKFAAILTSHPLYSVASSTYKKRFDEIYPLIEREIFIYEEPFKQLGYHHKKAVTAYFSPSFTEEELNLLKEFFAEKKIDPLNTRAFKTDEGFEVTVGSIDESSTAYEFKGKKITVIYGEYKPMLEELTYWLEKALPYCANENQKKMVECYLKSYKTGSIDEHKDSQRHWIKDKGPVVECN